MNRQLDATLNAAAATMPTTIADLTPTPNRAVERTIQRSASNDATNRPISAVDAMALCMRDSTFGG
jgi:hypothetical protein